MVLGREAMGTEKGMQQVRKEERNQRRNNEKKEQIEEAEMPPNE